MELKALNKIQLIERLQNHDISVPPKRRNRTNKHAEIWSIARTLATLAEFNLLTYPLKVTKNERPDYLIKQDSKTFGFEITEAINPMYVKALSLPEAQKEGSVIDIGHFRWNQKLNLEQLRDISSRTKLTAMPWIGNEVEREYAQMIRDVINKKTKILNKIGFSKHEENNLIIYVNQSLPDIEHKEATYLCNKSLANYWGKNSFNKVYVECDQEIHYYSELGVTRFPLNNLWK